jgi:hypothetical protein
MREQITERDRTHGRDRVVERAFRILEDAHVLELRRHESLGRWHRPYFFFGFRSPIAQRNEELRMKS